MTTIRRVGLRSGGPPEPATEPKPPRMTIRIPAVAGNREIASTVERLEAAPPDYTEQVEPGLVGIPRTDEEPSDPKLEQPREARSEVSEETS